MAPAPPTAFEATPPREPMTVPPDRWFSESRLVMAVFWLVAIATQLSWNHLANMTVGTGWFVTIGLALCGMFLVLAVRIPFRQALGPPGYLVAAALMFYVVIGVGVAIVTDPEWRLEDGRVCLHVGLALLLITASAFGAQVVLRRIGTDRLLARILVIKAVMCILILATPLLIEHVYRSLPDFYRFRSGSAFRFMGPFEGPNSAGSAACQTVVLALSLLNSRYRGFAGLAVILGSATTIMTFSKSAILTLVSVLVFFLWSSMSDVYSGRRRSTAAWLVPMFVVGIIGLAAVNLEHLSLDQYQLGRVYWMLDLKASIAMDMDPRFQSWRQAVHLIMESPLLGHGLPQFHSIASGSICFSEGGFVDCGAHNTYMLLWGEAGIVPLALFLLFIGTLLRMRLALPKSIAIDTVTGWTLVLAVECMSTDDVPFYTWNAFIIGLSCALAAHAVRESRRHKAEPAPEAQPAPVRTVPYGVSP